jgi:hypothetical protein
MKGYIIFPGVDEGKQTMVGSRTCSAQTPNNGLPDFVAFVLLQ